ncbi:hypothetical protein [Actinomadura yumaensis]|uniref:DUF5709 domain-containing protein n=1 Tax=Actinomadura yumaensis TaxID=111807 RepID=A0ABW2CSZ5_9ACTN
MTPDPTLNLDGQGDQADEAELVQGMDPASAGAVTEADEEDILRALYGPPDVDGIYRGQPAGPEDDTAPVTVDGEV